MKKFIFLLVAICAIFSASATVVQKIVLKNGSVLNGYIQRQDGTGKMTISTESATICLKNSGLSISMGKLEYKASLSDAWKEWIEENECYTSETEGEKLLFSDVTLSKIDTTTRKKLTAFEASLHDGNRMFSHVFISEKGSNVRFVEMNTNQYLISWDDVVSITSDRRANNALSGIDRKYTLKSNRDVSGQYAGETETTISLYQTNGVVETVDYNDIVKIGYYGINPQQDIFAQSELIDVVNTKSNGSIRGIIIEQNYSSDKDNENYISIWVKGRSPQMIKISDIKEVCKETNSDYKPKFDIILKDGQVMVNRNEVAYIGLSERNNMLALDSIGNLQKIDLVNNGETHIIVEMKKSVDLTADTYQLVPVKKVQAKKDVIYGFTYKELVDSQIRPISDEISVNKTIKVDFVVKQRGVYALYDSKQKRAILLHVK